MERAESAAGHKFFTARPQASSSNTRESITRRLRTPAVFDGSFQAQSTGDPTPNALDLGPRCPTCPIVIPARPLSAKDKQDRAQRSAQKEDYSVANAARRRFIDDETNKMLILVRDLKAKIDGLGSEPPSAVMLREAAVIEFLAKDIKEKMKLTVNPD
jgi:hypothetical protein